MSEIKLPIYQGASMPSNIETTPVTRAHKAFMSTIGTLGIAVRESGEMIERSLAVSQNLEDLATGNKQNIAQNEIASAWEQDCKANNVVGTASLDLWNNKYSPKYENQRYSYSSPEVQAKAQAQRSTFLSNMKIQASEYAIKSQNAHNLKELDASLKYYEDTGRYEDARSLISGATGSIYTPAEAQLMMSRVNKNEALKGIENDMVQNPGQLWEDLQGNKYDSTLSPYEKDKLKKQLSDKGQEQNRDAFMRDFNLVKAGKKEASSLKSAKAMGMFTKQESEWIDITNANKGHLVVDDIKRAAIKEAACFKPNQGDEEWSMAKKKYMAKYHGVFDVDKSFLEQQWSRAEEARKNQKHSTIDLKSHLEYMQSQKAFRLDDFIDPASEKLFEKGRDFRERNAILAGITDKDKTKEAYQKFQAYQKKAATRQVEAEIITQFTEWRNSPEGKDANAVQQKEKVISISSQVTGDTDKVSYYKGDVFTLDLFKDMLAKVQESKHRDWLKENMAHVFRDVEAEDRGQTAVFAYDTKQKELPSGILLPEGMKEQYGVGDVVEMTFDNENYREMPVVGYSSEDTPQISYAAAKERRCSPEARYKLNYKIRKVESESGLKIKTGKYPSLQKNVSSGLSSYVPTVIELSEKHGIDPLLVLAIAEHETGGGTSSAFLNKNNALGVSPEGKGPRSFGSVEESFAFMIPILKKNYLDKGLTTIDAIAPKYAPIGANNDPSSLNQHWVKGVTHYYNKLSQS